MNFGMKSKTFNILGTPDVLPGQVLGTCLEPGARIIGIISSTTSGGGDVASWGLFASVGGLDVAVANSNITGTATARSRVWWAGIDGRYNDTEIITTSAAADTQRGFWPLTAPDKWADAGGSSYELKLVVDTTLFGNVIVLYTVDPPNSYGDHC